MSKEIEELREAAREIVRIFSPVGLSEEQRGALKRLKMAILHEAFSRFELEDSLVTVTEEKKENE